VTATQGIFKSTSGNQLRIAYDDSYYWNVQRVAADGRLSFSDSVNGEKLVLTTGGNVGIGTASPAQKVHVEDNSSVTRIMVDNTANAAAGSGIYMRTLSGGTVVSNATLRVDNSGNFQIFSGASSDAIRLHCSANGNTGIGTASPTNLLHLTGSSSTPSLRLGSVSAGFHWDIGRENATTGDFVFNQTSSGGSAAERLRITSNGITFNGDTAAANALDDYEEGTWTPTSVSGGLTINLQRASYTKIGNVVTIQFYADIPTAGNGDPVILGGLPFNNASNGWSPGATDISRCAKIGVIARVEGGSNRIQFLVSSGSTSIDRLELKGNELGNSSYIIFTVQYRTS
jgi:hypothetical protein